MEDKLFKRINASWLCAVLCLLCPLASGRLFCPLSCICVFDGALTDNEATCDFGNTSLQVAWGNDVFITLNITCKNSYPGQQFDCAEFPHFNISDEIWVKTRGCAPSVTRCAHTLLQQPSRVVFLSTAETRGAYTQNDLVGMERVNLFSIRLKDDDILVPATVINYMPSLTGTIITGGKLRLTPNVFNHNKLWSLELTESYIEELAPNAFAGLPKLASLNVKNSVFTNLGAESFKGLSGLHLLEISDSKLTTIDPDAFSSLTQLYYLDIDKNRLKHVPNGLFVGLEELIWILFKKNQVEMTLGTYAFANLPTNVSLVNIAQSRVRYLPEHLLNGSTKLELLDFRENLIETLPPRLFATNIGLTQVNFTHNKIKELPDNIFAAMKRLQFIDLGYNFISSLKGGTFTHSSELQYVYLNNNQISHMDRDIFNGTNLDTLTLAHNKLQRILGDFSPGWSTRKLNLSHNELSVFEDWFVQLNELQYLDLCSNRIKMIKESHIHHKKTNITIDLRNNNITTILRDITNKEVLLAPGNVTLYLSNNPLDCDCDVTTVLKQWQMYGILADIENITCSDNEKLSKLSSYVVCNKTHALIGLIGSSVVGTFVCLLLLMYLFANRNKIWKFLTTVFVSTNKFTFCKLGPKNIRGANNHTFEMEGEAVKPYDLFLSFAHPDSEFVMDKLLPVLEHELNLKVCVHYRDWIVGDLISDQIKESVKSSTMTMILLTEHFVLSEWSSLEFRIAHNLSIEDGTPRLIIILLDEAVSRHEGLTSDMKLYLGVNTYLLFEDMHFWEKLQKVLPKKNKKKNMR